MKFNTTKLKGNRAILFIYSQANEHTTTKFCPKEFDTSPNMITDIFLVEKLCF